MQISLKNRIRQKQREATENDLGLHDGFSWFADLGEMQENYELTYRNFIDK